MRFAVVPLLAAVCLTCPATGQGRFVAPPVRPPAPPPPVIRPPLPPRPPVVPIPPQRPGTLPPGTRRGPAATGRTPTTRRGPAPTARTGTVAAREDEPKAADDGVPWQYLGLICPLAVAAAAVAAVLRSGPAGRVRVTATPPGDAPDDIRAAWVGVELPLDRGRTEPAPVPTTGVFDSDGSTVAWVGYRVRGPAAVSALRAVNPTAADWWTANVPQVLAADYELVFPADVCEKLT